MIYDSIVYVMKLQQGQMSERVAWAVLGTCVNKGLATMTG